MQEKNRGNDLSEVLDTEKEAFEREEIVLIRPKDSKYLQSVPIGFSFNAVKAYTIPAEAFLPYYCLLKKKFAQTAAKGPEMFSSSQ